MLGFLFFEKIFKLMINVKTMKYLDEKATQNLVFALKNTWNSDPDVKEIISFMADPKGKYEPIKMSSLSIEAALERYGSRGKLFKYQGKDLIPLYGLSRYARRIENLPHPKGDFFIGWREFGMTALHHWLYPLVAGGVILGIVKGIKQLF